ncbi:hypothetical protein V8C35DRAFT_304951 [Trichoderma chlorosporum]
MAWLSRLSAVAALATVAIAAESATTSSNSTAAEPCAQIAALAKKNVSEFSSQLGLACLESLPFKSDLATSFVDEYTKYLQWQSTSEILRNPPKGSLSSTIDLFGGMSNIRDRASANLYSSQYDFDLDVSNLISFANDGHLAIQPCSFVIAFINSVQLVSLSTDGVAIPKLYTASDGVLLAGGNSDVSPVTLINGVGAEAYLEELAENVGLQDPDARYNSMLANVPIARDGTTNPGGFSIFVSFPGVHEFNLTYANGTQASHPLSAVVNLSDGGDFTFQSGDELWSAVCDPASAPSTTTSSKRSTHGIVKSVRRDGGAKDQPAPETYPEPTVKDPLNLLIGYLPDDAELKDVAVLTVPTFSTSGAGIPDDEIKNFALEAQEFVQKALGAGKSKIIIDVTNNPGGTVDSGFALVSIFFPNMTIFSATRFRSVASTQFVVETINRVKNPDSTGLADLFFVPELVKPDQKSTFASLQDFQGPFDTFGVPSTAIVAENSFINTDPKNDPINIFGLGGALNETSPPFKPEDIVILTDGQCSSTCTIFINHMIPHGVRVFTSGGRPQNGPMQGIGGVKGSQVLELSDLSSIYDEVNGLVQNATDAKEPLFTDKEFAVFSPTIPVPLAKLPFRVNGGSVNFRNAFSPFDDQRPTHFIYQPADCRLFYTAAMLTKPELLWVNAAKAAWDNGECAFSTAPSKAATPSSGSTNSASTSTAAPKPTTTTSSSDVQTPASGDASASTKKKTLSPAHKAMGLLLAMAEGLRPQ